MTRVWCGGVYRENLSINCQSLSIKKATIATSWPCRLLQIVQTSSNCGADGGRSEP